MRRLVIFALAVLVLLAGCTSGGSPRPSASERTVTGTVTSTRDTGTGFVPPAASYAPTLSKGKPPKDEKTAHCPYIRSGRDEDPTSKPNVADIGGSRVGLTTTLPSLRPVGCRFYFSYGPQAVADILPRTFPSAVAARNAMIRTGEAGTDFAGLPQLAAGVDAVKYRTRFERGDGARDWAIAFAKGPVLVVVHTREATTSYNAVNLAKAIVAEF